MLAEPGRAALQGRGRRPERRHETQMTQRPELGIVGLEEGAVVPDLGIAEEGIDVVDRREGHLMPTSQRQELLRRQARDIGPELAMEGAKVRGTRGWVGKTRVVGNVVPIQRCANPPELVVLQNETDDVAVARLEDPID